MDVNLAPSVLALLASLSCAVDHNQALLRESKAAVDLARSQMAALHIEGASVKLGLPDADQTGPEIESATHSLGLATGPNRITVRLREPADAVTRASALLVSVEPAGQHVRVEVPAGATELDLSFTTTGDIRARNDLLVLSLVAVDSDGRAGQKVRVGLRVGNPGGGTRRMTVLPNVIKPGEDLPSTLASSTSSVLAIAMVSGKDTAYLAVGGRRPDGGGTVAVWDLKGGRVVRRFDDHTGAVLSVGYEPTTQILGSGSADHTVRLRRAGSGELLATLGEHTDDVRAVAWSPDGSALVTADRDGRVITRDPETGAAREVVETGLAINAAAFGAGTFGIAAGGLFEPGHLTVTEASTGASRLSVDFPEAATALAFSGDGSRVVVAAGRGELHVFDIASGDVLAELNPPCTVGSAECAEQSRSLGADSVPAPRDTLSAVAFGDLEGRSVVSTSLLGTLAVWSLKAGKMTAGIELGTPVLSGHVSADAQTVAVGLGTGTTLVLTLAE